MWPSLEYAGSVWDHYYKTHNLTIEKVQRRAARWTLGNYDYHSGVSAMLQNINWPIYIATLQYIAIADKVLDYHCFTNLYII